MQCLVIAHLFRAIMFICLIYRAESHVHANVLGDNTADHDSDGLTFGVFWMHISCVCGRAGV